MFARIGGALALAFVFVAGPAFAKDIPTGGFTVQDVVTWLQEAGYKAQIVTGSDGKQHVSSVTQGVSFGVYMFDCDKTNHCGSIQFAAGWATHGKFDTARMNEWNRDNRWARGYFDRENDPWLEFDIDLTPGGTYELLNDELATWNTMVDRFVKLYGL